MTDTHPSHRTQLREQLGMALEEAQSAEREWTNKLNHVKSRLSKLKDESKRLRKMLDTLDGNHQRGTNKEVLRPLVAKVLAERGPLDRKALAAVLRQIMQESNLPVIGMPLVLGALASEFANESDLWRLPKDAEKQREETPQS